MHGEPTYLPPKIGFCTSPGMTGMIRKLTQLAIGLGRSPFDARVGAVETRRKPLGSDRKAVDAPLRLCTPKGARRYFDRAEAVRLHTRIGSHGGSAK